MPDDVQVEWVFPRGERACFPKVQGSRGERLLRTSQLGSSVVQKSTDLFSADEAVK